ncbi:hypothetical protein H5410_005492 [Solanum commersonii]|uniref:Uncharacterized protein n=1 Tax=Solanum commersonii TaxID=4109 RepID=A0A9J6A7H0_SOLCO|nr:hypothetical protein H5410_005492 [Solanum commersonii]
MACYVTRTLHFCRRTRLDTTLVRARVRVEFGQSDPDTLTRAEKKIWGKGDQFPATSSERRRSYTKLEKVQRRRKRRSFFLKKLFLALFCTWKHLIQSLAFAVLISQLIPSIARMNKKEEIAWRQRSRTLWLKEGDRNTKYFHRIANAHKRYNNIDQLEVEGEITQDTKKIEKEVIDFYQRLYTETSRWRPTSNIPNCPAISLEEKESLQRNFEEDEVLRCLKLCAMDKAPGPEGFTMGFYIK